MKTLTDALIMIVDDNPINLKLLASILSDLGCHFQLCLSASEALLALEQDVPDMAFLDVMMPETNGYELCLILRKHPKMTDAPIVFLTAKVDNEAIIKGFEVGGNDYITKPFNEAELRARLINQLTIKFTRDELLYEQRQMAIMMHQLEVAATVDHLTNLFNRRAMMAHLVAENGRCQRTGESFAVIMADIDFFKRVNDEYGHACGDMVLVEIAHVLQACLRSEDVVSRWGGEEFLILLPETDLKGAVYLAERIRMSVEALQINFHKTLISVTITLGVAVHHKHQTIDKTITCADDALYRGKAEGRNMVHI